MLYGRFIVVVCVILMPVFAHGATQDDSYIAGYAAGVLKHSLNLELPSLNVRDGVITLSVTGLEAADRAEAIRILAEIPGVNAIKITETTRQASMDNASGYVQVNKESKILPTGILPDGHLFKALLADPRWAHFSSSYRNYQSDNFDGTDIASVSFGETSPIYRSNFGQSTVQWEAGLQAAVFSDFNMNSSSSDLINSDFIASIYTSVRSGQFSAFARIFHQSSHLGDEFLLRKIPSNFERVNLSYEGIDLRLSYELPYGVRFYGGGGGLFHREPSALKIWSTQYGIEYRSPWRNEYLAMRPIVADDFKNFDENNWNTDISARAGVEFDNSEVLGRKLQFLVEYYNGYSPSGQFYNNKVEYVGIGAHYLF